VNNLCFAYFIGRNLNFLRLFDLYLYLDSVVIYTVVWPKLLILESDPGLNPDPTCQVNTDPNLFCQGITHPDSDSTF